MITLEGDGASLGIDDIVGNIPFWRVEGREILHAAPWREEAEVQGDPAIPLVNKRLAGDFLCMPFGRDDVTGGPIHGATANAPWEVVETGAAHAHLRLSVPVQGAVVDKHLRIDGPVLYQRHVVTGGQGAVNFAHHPMARMAAGGRLSFSPKRAVLTDPVAQREGRNLWALGQSVPGLTLARVGGGEWDLRHYPEHEMVEDFCTLVEAEGARIGWTVLMREAEDDMLVVVKDARVMPVTMLWVSNGGREFSPWNDRHRGVLGIEDGCAAGGLGFAASLSDNPFAAMGVTTALPLGGVQVIRHAMVALPRPKDWVEVAQVAVAGDALTLTEAGGARMSVAFDGGFFP
ncbi:aldose epimerase family protein [Roseicyclus marinus]|uniref:hypothetical protein n=1 Tax=Roseicyclus marinus TaxID=2161673 RepID=UPI002410A849|nr:hypothetical protein [Roseicyclus marinus]MDG3040208.1 hypothetical protein [Roseicyclus marinus]